MNPPPIDAAAPTPPGAQEPAADPVADPVAEANAEPAARFGVFLRHGHRFAVPIDCVVEVLPGQPLTPVPRADPEVGGLVNLRGEILTVLLADSWLNVSGQPSQKSRPILVLRQAENLFGIEVDRVEGVLAIADTQIDATRPEGLPMPRARCAGWWHPADQTPCTILAADAFHDLVCPLEVCGDP